MEENLVGGGCGGGREGGREGSREVIRRDGMGEMISRIKAEEGLSGSKLSRSQHHKLTDAFSRGFWQDRCVKDGEV